MAAPQSCANYTILLMLMLTGTVFGSLFWITDSEGPARPHEPVPVTEISFASPNCVWTWGNESDPEGAARLQASLESDGFGGVSVSVRTFGEHCIPSDPNAEGYFAVMDSSPQITLPLADGTLLSDDAALGDMIALILPHIDNAGLTRPREIVILFESDGESREWRALSVDVDRALAGTEMFRVGAVSPE